GAPHAHVSESPPDCSSMRKLARACARAGEIAGSFEDKDRPVRGIDCSEIACSAAARAEGDRLGRVTEWDDLAASAVTVVNGATLHRTGDQRLRERHAHGHGRCSSHRGGGEGEGKANYP